MLNRLLELLRPEDTADATPAPELAAAALLFEVVWADHEIGHEEMQTMSVALAEEFSLSAERVAEILQETKDNLQDNVGVFPFTRVLNEQLDQTQKINVVRAMWRVAYADNHLDALEEHTVRRVADLLYVSHKDFIAAKHAARDTKSRDG
ncbi:MAG: TerB family tellurite resistance protein [Pseudomonadota bacterium]